jgi:hypothetical protein
MTTGRLPRRAALAAALLLAAACDTVDGTDPYALWEVCEHPDAAFHFHYLDPPWEPAPGFSLEGPVFLLDPSEDPAADPADPGARARLEAYAAAGNLAAEAAALRVGWEGLGFDVAEPELFVNRAGDVGVAQRAVRDELRVVDVILEGDRVVVLSLWSRAAVEGGDFDLLLAGFEPRGSGAH